MKKMKIRFRILKGMIHALAGLLDYLLVLAVKEVPQYNIPKRQYVRSTWRDRRSSRL
jgi:hypothetical protein